MKKMQQGFTLFELVIVVAIIGVLTALAIPAYQDFVVRTQVGEGVSLAESSKIAIAEFYNKTKRLPTTNTSAGLASPVSIIGEYVTSVNGASGVITVTYGAEANTRIAGRTLIYSAVTHAGSIMWACKHAPTVANRYRPQGCR